MKIRRIPITLDLQNRGNPVVVPAKQGDSGRVLVFQICNGGERMTITGTPQLAVKKKSGKRILNNCTVEEGSVVVALTNQALAEDGRQAAELRFAGEDGEIKTFLFWLDVERTVYDPDAIMSTNEFGYLDKWMQEIDKKAQEAIEEALDAAEKANDAADGIIIIPEIGENENWYIKDKDTGKPSRGRQGAPGKDGQPGPAGADGITPVLSVGEVITLEPNQPAEVTITGDPKTPKLNFGIPKGKPGAGGGTGGIPPTVSVGDTITGEPNTPAAVTNKGSETDIVLEFTIPRGADGTQGADGAPGKGVPAGGAAGQILRKKTGADYDTEWVTPETGGGITDITDISEIRERTYLVEIPDTKELTIASDREEILELVKTGKYKYLNIPDGIKHWAATDPKYNYPQKLTVEYIRNSEFYANMWLPNELNCHSGLRYAVNTNGTIRYDDVNDKTDLVGVLQWGILMLGDGKDYPQSTVHFILSNFRTLGFNSQTRAWELLQEMYPIAAMFNIKDTVADSDVVDIPGTDLKNGFYSFGVTQDKWHNAKGGEMCFHFYPKTGLLADALKKYENILIAYQLAVQEPQYDGVFTAMAGMDAKTAGGVNDAECFYSRFQSVRCYSKRISAISVLEAESYKYVFSGNQIQYLLCKSDVGGSITEEGYTELEFVSVDENVYFDTEIIPDQNTNFEIKFRVKALDAQGTMICGARDANYKYGITGTDNFYVVRGTVASAAKTVAYYDNYWVVKQNGNNVDFGGTSVTLDTADSLNLTTNFFVGNMSKDGNGTYGKGMNGEFYYCKIYSGASLVADIIPVRRSDGKICLYDKKRSKYLLNRGSGAVTT